MSLYYKFGNILDEVAKNDYTGHQTNAMWEGTAAGLAFHIFNKFKDANNYMPRNTNRVGHTEIRGKIANICGQYKPGGNDDARPTATPETSKMREEWFIAALDDFANQIGPGKRVALPTNIGCGLAGGSWPRYHTILEKWAQKNPTLHVTLIEFLPPRRIICDGNLLVLELAVELGFLTSGTCSMHNEIPDGFHMQYDTSTTLTESMMRVAIANVDEAEATLAFTSTPNVLIQKSACYAISGQWPHPLTFHTIRKNVQHNGPIRSLYKPTFVLTNTQFCSAEETATFAAENQRMSLNICAPEGTEHIPFLRSVLSAWIRSVSLKPTSAKRAVEELHDTRGTKHRKIEN